MRLARIGFLVFSCALAPGTGEAEELTLGVSGGFLYDSNILSRESGAIDDVSFQFAPSIDLSDRREALDYRVTYQPQFETFAQLDGSNSFNHTLRSTVRYAWSPRTSLSFNDRFSNLRGSRFDSLPAGDGGSVEVDRGQERSNRNSASLGMQHSFSQRAQGFASVGHSLFRSLDRDRSDSTSLSGSLSFSYAVTPKTFLGLGGATSYQVFEGGQSLATSRTKFYNAFATLNRRLSSTMSLTFQGGPALIDSKQGNPISEFGPVLRFPQFVDGRLLDFNTCTEELFSNCSQNPQDAIDRPSGFLNPLDKTLRFSGSPPKGASDLRTTFFGSMALTKRWQHWNASLSYRRSESPTVGDVGTSTTADSVRLATRWEVDRRWTLSLTAGWNRRQSVSDALVTTPTVELCVEAQCAGEPIAKFVGLTSISTSSAIDVTNWTAAAALSRQLANRLRATLEFRYRRQNSDSTLALTNDVQRFSVGLRFSYSIDPIRF